MAYASKFMKWLPRLVEASFVVAIIWLGFLVTFPSEGSTAVVTEKPEVVQKVELDIKKLAQSGLFGKIDEKVKVAPKSQVVVPSRLRLKLVGTIVSRKYSSAIISNASNGQKMYKVGYLIQPGVKLVEVGMDTIVVEHGGKFERITMERKQAVPTAMRFKRLQDKGK